MKVLKSFDPRVSKISFILLMLMTGMMVQAQVAINKDGSSPDASAMLHVKSSDKGMLIPRLTEAERDAISSPATGLMVFQTNNTTGFYYYDGSNWKVIGSGAFSIDDLSDGKAGGSNVFLGEGAGENDGGTYSDNVAVGYFALTSNTTGIYNTASGGECLFYNISGSSNTACGFQSLENNTIGNNNTAIGLGAGFSNIGSGSVYIGYNAGHSETGDNKLYIENSNSTTPLIYGEFDNDIIKINGDLEVTGSFTGIGIDDLSDGKTGGSSVFLGHNAGIYEDGIDRKNVAIGRAALWSDTSGSQNVAVGYNALYDNKSGNYNTAIGRSAMQDNTIGVDNTGTGYISLASNTEGNYNTANGVAALYKNTTGNTNTAMGENASRENSIGSNNVAIGAGANKNNVEGSDNTIIGYHAGDGTALHNKSGNIFLGYKAGYNETGDNKLYIENSLSSAPLIYGEFDNNILAVNGDLGVGTQTPGVKLQVVGGTDAILSGGGYLVTGQTTGQNIVMDENEIMARNNGAISAIHLQRDGGAFNLHYGLAESNEFVVATDGKTGIGDNSPSAKLHINTISGEDGLRVQTVGATKLKVASNGGVGVGYNPTTPTFALQLQNSSVDLEGKAVAYSWTTYSDGRLKTDQKTLEYGLNEVMQLQPKSYFHHNSETKEDGTFVMVGTHKTHTFGFIAQELNQIIPEAVYVPEDETKNLWAIDYEKLIPVLTKAMQEQQQEIETLKAEIEGMKQMIREQRK